MNKRLIYQVISIFLLGVIFLFIINLRNTAYINFNDVNEVKIRVPSFYEGTGFEWDEYKFSKEEASDIIKYLNELEVKRYKNQDSCLKITYEVIISMDRKDITFKFGCDLMQIYNSSDFKIKIYPLNAIVDLDEYETVIEGVLKEHSIKLITRG